MSSSDYDVWYVLPEANIWEEFVAWLIGDLSQKFIMWPYLFFTHPSGWREFRGNGFGWVGLLFPASVAGLGVATWQLLSAASRNSVEMVHIGWFAVALAIYTFFGVWFLILEHFHMMDDR